MNHIFSTLKAAIDFQLSITKHFIICFIRSFCPCHRSKTIYHHPNPYENMNHELITYINRDIPLYLYLVN